MRAGPARENGEHGIMFNDQARREGKARALNHGSDRRDHRIVARVQANTLGVDGRPSGPDARRMSDKHTLRISLDLDPELHGILESAAARCGTTPAQLAVEMLHLGKDWLAQVAPRPRAEVKDLVRRMALWLRASLGTDAVGVADRDLPAWCGSKAALHSCAVEGHEMTGPPRRSTA